MEITVSRREIEKQQIILYEELKTIRLIHQDLLNLMKLEDPLSDKYRMMKNTISLVDDIEDNISFRKRFLESLPEEIKRVSNKIDVIIAQLETEVIKNHLN